VPFRVTLVAPGSRLEIQFEEVRQNVAIAAERFRKP
jgi:hypothetical protein